MPASIGIAVALAALLAAMPSLSADCRVSSGPRTAALVELYTSEGCSSCPPADRWISAFAAAPRKDVVPVAFHVDYWDSLGWKDRLADPRFTARQAAGMRAAGARFVYTPQVIVGGRDLPSWRSPGSFSLAVARIHARPARASIEIVSRIAGDGSVTADVATMLDRGVDAAHLELVVALTQDGLASRVTAGENRGERLAHDFVVRDLATSQPGGVAHASFERPAQADVSRLRVTAFVQDRATGEVLQALAAPLCR
ncbi:MAG TPA: DUF1223 domain-containing protein [Usitatibacter sp.]|nr:DUF1223 domain-containing protein [Usitatibacter sp.]